MKKVLGSLKEVPFNGVVILVVIALYSLNRFVLKLYVQGWIGYFLRCHFNDFLCGILFIAYSNVFINTRGKMITKPPHILALCFSAGLVWEFIVPLVKRNSTADWLDVLFYMLGGLVYWLLVTLFVLKKGDKEDDNRS